MSEPLSARPPRPRRAVLAFAAGAASLLAAALVLPSWSGAPAQQRTPPLPGRFGGVNLAGGEFAGKRIPGRYGYDYSYPDAKTAAPFARAGFRGVRLPIRWERIQPVAMGPLDDAEMARIDRSLAALASFDPVIVDVHNYARYRRGRLDRSPGGDAALADLWRRLADRYRDRPRIAFGMMNEPHGLSAAAWRGMADRAMAAIRGTGARNLVLVPGTRWTGAHSWTAGGPLSNAEAMRGFTDPANNFAFELHQYLDEDSSGQGTACVQPERAAARLADVTEWLRRERARGVLAEFGAADEPNCLAGLEAMLRTMDANGDVWLGWTWWAAGARWGGYPFSIQPRGGEPDGRMRLLVRYLPRRA